MMNLAVTPLHPLFVATVTGVDLRNPIDEPDAPPWSREFDLVPTKRDLGRSDHRVGSADTKVVPCPSTDTQVSSPSCSSSTIWRHEVKPSPCPSGLVV